MRKLIFLLTCLFIAVPCLADTIYVDVNTPDNNDGSSWAKAYKYLQDALADANSNGDVNEIRVAQGTYRPNDGIVPGSNDQELSFQFKDGVTIKGGYAGFGESNPDFRNTSLYETILSGDIDNDGILDADNSWHVIESDIAGVGPTGRIDGFTITMGYADDNSQWYEEHGGGIFIWYDSPTIENCRIINNYTTGMGGGMSVWHGAPIVNNCVFSNNTSEYGGGAINNYGASTLFTNSIFRENSGSYGGAICSGGDNFSSCNVVIKYCTFFNNTAENCGGAIFGSDFGDTTILGSILYGNNAVYGSEIGAETIEWGVRLTVGYSDIKGGQAAIYGNHVDWGLGNIDVDPCFVDPCNGDYHLKSEAGRWDPNTGTWVQDAVTSPCIDAGNPGCPLADEPNDANNVRVNMGAYGGTAEASKSPANWALLADLTNDRKVDSDDLAAFVRFWPDNGQCIPSDLDHNESVNSVDFAIFANEWLWEE